MIAAIALVVVPPSPQSVSEFAPQVVEQIEDSPEKQSSQFGTGAGGLCATGQLCEGSVTPGISPSKKVIEKARVRRCVGDPPRQIEDPQSPPCLNYWQGDNGGATTKGVTRDETRVSYAYDGSRESINLAEAIFAFFNRRFEFYGRRLTVQEIPKPKDIFDPVQQRAAAISVAEEQRAFAAVNWYWPDGSDPFFEQLARKGVLGVSVEGTYGTSDSFNKLAPYRWTYFPTLDEINKNVGEFICKSLAGRNASHAGPLLAGSKRVFGIALDRNSGSPPTVEQLVDAMRRCDSAPVTVIEVESRTDPNYWRGVAANFQAAGVTSILCFCTALEQSGLIFRDCASTSRSAPSQYQPEWVANGLSGLFGERAFSLCPDESSRIFGVGAWGKPIPFEDRPWYWAIKEVLPDAKIPQFAEYYLSPLYEGMLLLASGIQMAGPRLTATAFEKGLQATSFPNPGTGKSPYWQPEVGFGPGDHAMVNDFPLIYWSADAPQASAPTAGYCYLYRGARWSLGSWPNGPQPFFDRTQQCR